jgi:manganese efflux pump family protein
LTFGAILLLAVGVAMDATAVSAARGLAVPAIRARHVLLVAGFFGGFQALMPAIGWALGARLGPLVQTWDHWIAFVLLALIGGKMLWEALEAGGNVGQATVDHFAVKSMFVLAIATSIDALAVGITLPMVDAPFALSIATIGVVTGLLSAIGLFAGRRFGAMLGKRLDAAGGLVLIGLGVKILLEHLLAS